jgi:hypothetical protein
MEKMIIEDKCKCGMCIPMGYGYYNYNRKVKCFGCGRINQNGKSEIKIKENWRK